MMKWGDIMDVFNRHSIYSSIVFIDKEEFKGNSYSNVPDIKAEHIISIGVTDDYVIIEYVPDYDNKWDKYLADKQANTTPANNDADNKPKIPAKVKQAYDTVLNTDPFNMGVKGLTFAEIYEKHPDWVEKARADLLNTFILGKMQIIDEYLGG